MVSLNRRRTNRRKKNRRRTNRRKKRTPLVRSYSNMRGGSEDPEDPHSLTTFLTGIGLNHQRDIVDLYVSAAGGINDLISMYDMMENNDEGGVEDMRELTGALGLSEEEPEIFYENIRDFRRRMRGDRQPQQRPQPQEEDEPFIDVEVEVPVSEDWSSGHWIQAITEFGDRIQFLLPEGLEEAPCIMSIICR